MSDEPRSRTWELPHDLTAARAARAHVAQFLPDLAPDLVDDLTLIASELAANTVRHGSAPGVLTLVREPRSVRVSVQSTSRDEDPEIQYADVTTPTGRGLGIVESLAADWGWSRDGDLVTVWATLSCSAPAAPEAPTPEEPR